MMVDVLELDRRNHPDLAVHTPMVEPVDVLRDRDLQALDGLEWPLVPDQLRLEQRVERLREGIDAPIVVNSRSDRCEGWSSRGGIPRGSRTS